MEPKRERHPPSLLASALVSLRVPLTAKEKKKYFDEFSGFKPL